MLKCRSRNTGRKEKKMNIIKVLEEKLNIRCLLGRGGAKVKVLNMFWDRGSEA